MTKYRFDVFIWDTAKNDWDIQSMGAAPSEEAAAAMLRSVADHLDPPKAVMREDRQPLDWIPGKGKGKL